MTKFHENHQARSPYEPGEAVDKPVKEPGRGVGGKPAKTDEKAEAPPKKKAAKKKAAK